jgi:hypothetical protein
MGERALDRRATMPDEKKSAPRPERIDGGPVRRIDRGTGGDLLDAIDKVIEDERSKGDIWADIELDQKREVP